MNRLAAASLSLILGALAGCGLREPLEPLPGQEAPPVPAMASEPLTTEEMLTPPPIARPERVDELLRRSEERSADRFDLPPGDVPVADSEDDEPE
jgi:predicted small lipoprotein YifL